MARLICTHAVIVCSYVWMSNHVHMQIISQDIADFTHFHERLKKQLTDLLKRLVSITHLNLWEKRTSVPEVLDLRAAIRRIVYTYLNPVRAGIVSSIDHYQGCNTWSDFLAAPASIDSFVEKEVPWIKATDIPPLSQENPGLPEERRAIREINDKAQGRSTFKLRVYPFRWLKAFGVTRPEQIERIRALIIQMVRDGEKKLAPRKEPNRRLDGFVVTDRYKPKKRERRIFMFASTKARRLKHLLEYRHFCRICDACYELMKQGVKQIPWPRECFIPPAPKLCNVF
jgi:REP element-mobilizing transposase RayT